MIYPEFITHCVSIFAENHTLVYWASHQFHCAFFTTVNMSTSQKYYLPKSLTANLTNQSVFKFFIFFL